MKPLLLVAMLAFMAQAGWAQTVQVSPATSNVVAGDPAFNVTVQISGVSNLQASRVEFTFDNTVVQYNGVTRGSVMNGTNDVFQAIPAPGASVNKVIVDQAVMGASPADGNGSLFTISFVPLKGGTSPIDLTVTLRDPMNNTIVATVNDGQVNAGYPLPTLASISPTAKTVGDATFLLTVTGTKFVDGISVVQVNGSPRTTTFVSSTELTASILASDLLTAGSRSITVANGGPGGGTSSAQALTVNKATTSTSLISSLNPSSSGQSVQWTATVTPSAATGSVEFFDGTTLLGAGTITAGSAVYSTAALTPGIHTVKAVYGGDANYLASENTLSQTVNPVIIASSGGNGTIDPAGSVTVALNGSQKFTFTPADHYHVVDVVVDAVSLGALPSYTFSDVTQNHTISVSFAVNAYTITVTAGLHGTITPPGPSVSVNHGDSSQFTMTPAAGYHVATLTIDGVRVNPKTTHTFSAVTGDHSIGATFAVDSYAITGPTEYDLDVDGDGVIDMKVNLATKPAGDATISATAYVTTPDGYPALPPDGLPFYLVVNSTLPAHAFAATVRLDLNSVTGFGPGSVPAYFNSTTSSWVFIDGTYLDSDPLFGGHPSFTFQTDNFTPIVFFGLPEPLLHIYGSISPTVVAQGTIYPNNSWRPDGPSYGGADDWAWSDSQVVSIYLVPEVGAHFGAADITLEWDITTISLSSVDFGSAPSGLYSPGQAYSPSTTVSTPYGPGKVRIQGTRADGGNFSVYAGQYIARVNFTLLKPGHSPVAIIGANFQILRPTRTTYLVPMQAEVKTYLADVASSGNPNTGDGKVNYDDLAAWSMSYWAGVSGYTGPAEYKAKYDFGPTADSYLFSLPQLDGKIDFDDLSIFAISYGQTAGRYLPKVLADASGPLEISLGASRANGDEVSIPIVLGGSVADVRALKLEVSGQFGSFLGAEKGELLQRYKSPVALLNRADGKSVFLDLAVMGLDATGLDSPGEVAILRFAGTPRVQLTGFEARGSRNSPLEMKEVRGAGEGQPTEFALLQNYPNPFNPKTGVRYQVSGVSDVKITVYDLLGRQVAVLVDETKPAGTYTVTFNATGLASGTYIYRMKAGSFVQTRKMILLK